MASELERWIQAALATPRQAISQANTLLQSFLENLGVITDTATERANGNTGMIWDAAANAGGLWDDYCWDAAPGALSVGGLVWDSVGTNGKWDQSGVVWNP